MESPEALRRRARRPWAPFVSLARHRDLAGRLVAREVAARFRGSALGLAWAVIIPLLTAAAYTFVFTEVFKSRWGDGSGGPFDFSLLMLTGLAVHGLFAETVSRAPGLLVGNANYVTKVVFPIEVLPFVVVASGLVNALIGVVIVLVGQFLLKGQLPWTAVFLPVVWLPYLVFLVAATMILAALGVFLRDLAQVVGLVVTLSLFLTPIFFPLSAVPPAFRAVMRANPLTPVVEQTRTVLIGGAPPDFAGLGLYLACALALLAGANWLFHRLRPAFADVL